MSNNKTTSVKEHLALSTDGARRALNYILDLAKKRKTAVTFILDEASGNIFEVGNPHTKEIEVERRIRER